MHASRISLSVAFIGLAVLISSCDCAGKIQSSNPCENVARGEPGKTGACNNSSECSERYSCNAIKGQDVSCCVLADRKCNTEADCCPGQTCTSRNTCFDSKRECESDADCGDKGDMFCETYTDVYGSSKRCRYKPCTALGECPSGQACFQGECLADLPCGGSCESGKACVPTINRCQLYTSPSGREEAACPLSCAPGFLATFQDNRDIWDSCTLSKVDCICAELPPLMSTDLGRFSAISNDAARNQLWVSSYDGQYGDLVVYRFNSEGKLTNTDYVDGVPLGVTPRYGPSGARGGIVEPGPDVGRHTDIVVSGENTYVSYYDVSTGNLKVAVKSKDDAWTTMTVDGAQGDVGFYSSIAVDSDGNIGISYFQKGAAANFDANTCPGGAPSGDKAYITALKFAKAKKVIPTGEQDFIIKTVACQSRPVPACTGCAQTCADPGTGPSCYPAATGCTSCNANSEVCVSVGTEVKCAAKYNPANLQEVPDGVGLFSSLAFNGKNAKIVYMRREASKGSLVGVTVDGNLSVGSPVLLDGAGDTGWFPDIKVDSGKILVSYQDFSSRRLKFLTHSDFATSLTPLVIDNGAGAIGSGESNWVGADSSLIRSESNGKWYAVYQDSTRGDLKLAEYSGSSWKVLSTIRSAGAVGFFADGSILNNTLFVSHAQLRAKVFGGEPRLANSLILDKLSAP